jgi:hypothetical protein
MEPVTDIQTGHQNGDGWYTDRVIFEQDGNHPSTGWSGLETFDSDSDMFNGGSGQGKNHPRIYVE